MLSGTRILLAALFLGTWPLMQGCHPKADIHSASFSRNRAASLTRSVESARQANENAIAELSKGIMDMNAQIQSADRYAAFNESRRIVARGEGRVKTLTDRFNNVRENAQRLLEQWAREIPQFTDPARREKSSKDLADFKLRYELLKKSMAATEAALPPVLNLLRDDVLYLKYRRTVRTTEPAQVDMAKRTAAIENAAQSARATSAECKKFTDSMPALQWMNVEEAQGSEPLKPP